MSETVSPPASLVDLSRLPDLPADVEAVRAGVRSALEQGGIKLAVVDDDPTGTQTVRGLPLVTQWEERELMWAMATAAPLFGVLTNSRALAENDARAINGTIAERLAVVARTLGVGLRIISRGDSTLRGHFPAEPDALAAGLARQGIGTDAILLCPAFPQAGRVTLDGMHLVRRGERLLPAAETEYARDPAFGYESSRLTDWVRERAGRHTRVGSVTLEDLRRGGPEHVSRQLRSLCDDGVRYVVADAIEDADLTLLAAGIDSAERQGLRFIYRTGPSFLAARAGRSTPPTVADREIAAADGRGLVVAGSYTALTTRQLEHAQREHQLRTVALDVGRLLKAGPGESLGLVARAAADLREALAVGDAALVTTRIPQHAERGPASLRDGGVIADALVDIVAAVAADTPLAWMVAKGGITSHDMAVRALGAARATVVGQLFFGQVSLWELGEESLQPGLRYVVFPGNVGNGLTLTRALSRLKGAE